MGTTNIPDTTLGAKKDTSVKVSHYAQRSEKFVGNIYI